MSKDNIFFGGVPTEPEVRRLREAYPDASLTPDVTIPYEDAAHIIGCRASSTRFRTVTDRWRKMVEQNTGKIIGRFDGTHFRTLTESEKLELGEGKLRSAVRFSRRSHVVSGRVNIRDLSPEERARHERLQNRNASSLAG